MPEASGFKFNLSGAPDKRKDVAVDVSADCSATKQQRFVDSREEAMGDPGQGVRHSDDPEWADLPSAFARPIYLLMDRFQEANEACLSTGAMGSSVVEGSKGRRRPHFNDRFYNLAVERAARCEFRRVDLDQAAGRVDSAATADGLQGILSRLGCLGFAPEAGEACHVPRLEVDGVRIRYGLCLGCRT